MYATHAKAAARKRAEEMCTCGHPRSLHFGSTGQGCSRFKLAKSPTRGTRRSVRKYAGRAELDVAKQVGGRRVRNQGTKPGDVDVESETACYQVKHMKWSGPLRRGMEQVLIGASPGKRKLLVWTDKPGPGRKGQTVVCELIEDWVAYNGELPE